MNLKDFESRVIPDDHDPLLITPRLEAFRAKEKAVKDGDALGALYADARLSELKALELEDMS